jgi:hypothetical protein
VAVVVVVVVAYFMVLFLNFPGEEARETSG